MTQTIHTNIRLIEENGHWKATEPAADHELYGRGETAPLAVKHYAELIEESDPRTEVPADD